MRCISDHSILCLKWVKNIIETILRQKTLTTLVVDFFPTILSEMDINSMQELIPYIFVDIGFIFVCINHFSENWQCFEFSMSCHLQNENLSLKTSWGIIQIFTKYSIIFWKFYAKSLRTECSTDNINSKLK